MNSSLDWMIPLVPEELVIVSALVALVLDLSIVRRKTVAVRAAVGWHDGLPGLRGGHDLDRVLAAITEHPKCSP